MMKQPSIFQLMILKTLWYGTCVLAMICSVLFGILIHSSNKEIETEKTKVAKLEKSQQELQERITNNTNLYHHKQLETTTELNENLTSKELKIETLQKEIVATKQQKTIANQRWLDPLIASLDISQDIYAMKWQSNSQVLSDMENHSLRTLTVCKKWDELCEKLSSYPELAPQVAKLQIRLAQAYSGLALVDKVDLSKIDWKAAQMEAEKPEIEARIWFSIASQFARTGKLKKAQQYLEKTKTAITQMNATPEKATYFSSMLNLLEADIAATTDPNKSLKYYIQATNELAKVVTAVPKNTKLRTAFIQACLDGAMLSEGGISAGQAERLRARAFKNINTLLKNNPDIEKPHLLYAEVKILEAEEMLRKGEQFKASELIQTARTHIKDGGGSIILTAEADGSQAFIHWDHGERTKAMSIIDEAIGKVTQLKQAELTNMEAEYRLASLYWVRSSMQIAPADSIADGQKAVQYLVDMVQQGAGKREASARRMIAIIYGDIGHQAYSSDQKSIAKQYFEQARKQWAYLIKNWGQCDEYKEGERWCTWRINSL
jgi:tetratricopeptide (TPR) repeat protein